MEMLGCYGAGVEGQGEVLCHVHTKEFGALDPHRGFINVQWRVVNPWTPQIKRFTCFVHVQGQDVDFAPDD